MAHGAPGHGAESVTVSAPSRRVWLTLATLVAVVIVAGVLVITSGHDEPTREEVVATRGEAVMPFDLAATTHVFDPTSFGGVQQVIADDPGDEEQITLIRRHLRHEMERFRSGDFGDPATIHGHDMPGLAVLESRAEELEITLRELPDGAELTYRSDAPAVVEALHDWFAAQLADHGDHAATLGG
jgi:hypothetical protein